MFDYIPKDMKENLRSCIGDFGRSFNSRAWDILKEIKAIAQRNNDPEANILIEKINALEKDKFTNPIIEHLNEIDVLLNGVLPEPEYDDNDTCIYYISDLNTKKKGFYEYLLSSLWAEI